jgi:hypothetical protein
MYAQEKIKTFLRETVQIKVYLFLHPLFPLKKPAERRCVAVCFAASHRQVRDSNVGARPAPVILWLSSSNPGKHFAYVKYTTVSLHGLQIHRHQLTSHLTLRNQGSSQRGVNYLRTHNIHKKS